MKDTLRNGPLKMSLETNKFSQIINRVQMPEPLLKTTELALFLSVGQQVFDQSKKGEWINSAAKKILRSSGQELKKLPNISNADKKTIENYLDKFFDLAGWSGKVKNQATAINFCLTLFEKSSFEYNDGIKKSLSNTLSYLEKKSGFKPACVWGGELAWEKWNSLIN